MVSHWGETAPTGTTLAVLFAILAGALLLIPVLFLVLAFTVFRGDWEKHPRALGLFFLLVFILRVWYAPPALFTVGSLLLVYGVAALAHASRTATLSAMGIALLCSILLWGGLYLVRIVQERRRRGRPPHEIVG